MDTIKVLLVAQDDQARGELKNLLTSDEIVLVGQARTGAGALERAASQLPDVVVMLCDSKSGDELDVAERLYMSMTGCSVLLLHAEPSPTLLEKAMHAGVRKVLPWPPDAKELLDSIRLSYHMEKSRTTGARRQKVNWLSNIVSVFGTKGGIGKTTIAVNLAVSLSMRGKKVALLDFNLQLGDAGNMLDLDPKDTIAELAQDRASFDIDTIKSFMILHSSGVSVLCAPKRPEYAEYVSREHIDKIVNTLRAYFDYIIIDLPPMFTESSLDTIESSNLVLMAVTLDISSLRNSRIGLDLLESLHQKDKTRIIVNRVGDSAINLKDAQHILNTGIAYKMSSEWRTCICALNRGIPVVLDAPRTVIAREMYGISDLVMRELEK